MPHLVPILYSRPLLILTLIYIALISVFSLKYIYAESMISRLARHRAHGISKLSLPEILTSKAWTSQAFRVINEPPNDSDTTYNKSNMSVASNLVYKLFNVPIYVLTLRERTDRQQQMEILREALGLTWTYIYATEAGSQKVKTILEQVYWYRQTPQEQFKWPEDTIPTKYSDMTTWQDDFNHLLSKIPSSSNSTAIQIESVARLTCASNDSTIPVYNTSMREFQLLTSARIAVWHSHTTLLREILVNSTHSRQQVVPESEIAGIILEDDVDAERDIAQRMEGLWSMLPLDWDILFLGHCWSNESYYPAISPLSPATSGIDTSEQVTLLYPSYSPKCTHAYAISYKGARRILQHLDYPPFAYSRALDQALAWLILSGRLKSYSVVPSVVVQRKKSKSDVSQAVGSSKVDSVGTGSAWKDTLFHAIFHE